MFNKYIGLWKDRILLTLFDAEHRLIGILTRIWNGIPVVDCGFAVVVNAYPWGIGDIVVRLGAAVVAVVCSVVANVADDCVVVGNAEILVYGFAFNQCTKLIRVDSIENW